MLLRHTRVVELTPEGAHYLVSVRQAFGLLVDATGRMRRSSKREEVRVSLLSSFATNWLVPRLPSYARAHPDTDLVLDPTLRVADLNAGEADIAIRYGQGEWDGIESRLLMAERIAPVCSPTLAQSGLLAHPSDVLRQTLLLTMRPFDWEVWARVKGIDISGAQCVQLTDYNIVLQAAEDGQGVAMGRLLLIADRLRQGRLVRPCPDSVVTTPAIGHWVVLPRSRTPSRATLNFVAWIEEETSRQDQQTEADGSFAPT